MSYRNIRADFRDNIMRSIFFVVAFVPLWLILSINCGIAGICHWYLVAILIGFIVTLVAGTLHYIKKAYSSEEQNYFKIEKKDDITQNMVFYILAYIPVLFVEKFTATEIVAFVVLLAIVYLVYIKANMLHVNPVLTIMGYKTYRVTDDHRNTVVLLSRLNIRIGVEVPYVEIIPDINLVLDQQ